MKTLNLNPARMMLASAVCVGLIGCSADQAAKQPSSTAQQPAYLAPSQFASASKDAERVTTGDWLESAPLASPGGRSMLVQVDVAGKHRLDLIDTHTGLRRTLVESDVVDAAWLVGDKHILYTNKNTRAVSMRSLDGALDEVVFASTVLAADWKPRMSPDGEYAAVEISSRRGVGTYVLDVPAEEILTRIDGSPTGWHPNGRQFLVVRSVDGHDQVFLHNARMGSEAQLTSGAHHNRHASYSPDGSRIVFSSNRNGRFNLYVMDARGGDARRITRSEANDLSPSWSPDGYVYFASDRDVAAADRQNIWRVQPGN